MFFHSNPLRSVDRLNNKVVCFSPHLDGGRSTQLRSSRGFTLIELLIVIAIVGVLAGIATIHGREARMVANRAAAIGTLDAIRRAQDAFRVTCGEGSAYASSLAQLGKAQLVSPDLGGDGVRNGSLVVMIGSGTEGQPASRCTGEPMATGWYASAVPVSLGQSGRVGLATDQDHGIWEDSTGVAPAQPFAVGKTVRPIGDD